MPDKPKDQGKVSTDQPHEKREEEAPYDGGNTTDPPPTPDK
jgi:hypothetical protein